MSQGEKLSDDAFFFGDEDQRVAFDRVWFSLMRAHRKFHPRIAKALRTCGISDPIWYEILFEVERAGPDGQPMAALEDKLFVPQYALSRHVGRLEKEGFLRREYIADGRRKQILFLTEKGMGMHEHIWPVYREAMREQISPFLSSDDAYALSRLMFMMLPPPDP